MPPISVKNSRRLFALDIVVRRIGQHVVVLDFHRRVAPFLVFESGQRHPRIRHGGDDVDERHLGDNAREQVGTEIGDRAD